MPLALAAPLVASSLMLSGCMSSPTYGTDKTATAQLTSDLSGMFSMKPKASRVNEYKPRPDLVKPASLAELPQPQDNIAASGNAAWPESPEQRRARIRADATANQDNNLYEPLVINDISRKESNRAGMSPGERSDDDAAPMTSSASAREANREIARRKVEGKQGSPTTRKYLSEPPLTYRQPAETASADDLGEDELKKQRRLKREASGGKSWRDWVPGL